jgi:hypothetical protein
MPLEVTGGIGCTTSDSVCSVCSLVGGSVSPVTDKPVVVPDRELEEEKKPSEPSGPRIRCPLRLVAPKGRSLVLRLRA